MRSDLSYSQTIFSEALELAKKGDERGILTMRRKIQSEPESRETAAAREVLVEAGEFV